MKIARKAIAIFFMLAVVLLSVSCDKDDSMMAPPSFKTVSYGFRIEDKSMPGLTAKITYKDPNRGGESSTVEYKGNYDWKKVFQNTPNRFFPYMVIEIVKERPTFEEKDFPSKLLFTVGIVSGYESFIRPVEVKFQTLAEFNKFFEDKKNFFSFAPYN